jgi:hypothetical protein
LYGKFCCQKCHRNAERDEHDLLETNEEKNNPAQKKRLAVLKERNQNKLDLTNKRRANMDTEALQQEELSKNRALKHKKMKSYEENPALKENDLAATRARDASRRANNQGAPKKRGYRRTIKSKTPYPAFFQNKLKEAALKFAVEMGEPSVYWANLISLFDDLLVREKDRIKEESGGVIVVEMQDCGGIMKPYYIDECYRAAARQVLGEPTKTNPRHWIWKEYRKENDDKKNKKTADVAQKTVIGDLYPES